MKKNINIAIIGLGQIGSYLYNELNLKKKDIELKTGKKINIVAISAKSKNKKRKYKINKSIFYKNPLKIFENKNIDILFEVIGLEGGISKKVIEKASSITNSFKPIMQVPTCGNCGFKDSKLAEKCPSCKSTYII